MPRKKKIETEVVEEVKVEEVKEEKKPAKKVKKPEIEIINPRVRIRKSPSLLGEVIGYAIEGEKYELLSEDQDAGFYNIKFGEINAYVMAQFVKR